MFEQYKRTFWAVQIVIAMVTAFVLAWSRLLPVAGMFLFTMEVCAVIGAQWGVRLKRKVDRQTGLLV